MHDDLSLQQLLTMLANALDEADTVRLNIGWVIVQLHELHGLSYRRIAALTDRSYSTVWRIGQEYLHRQEQQ